MGEHPAGASPSSADLRIVLLGGTSAIVDGGPVKIAGRKPLALLALLALNAGHQVGADRLVDDLWGDESPDSAPNALQVYVAGLRRDLGPAGRRIRTEGQAYRLELEASDVDVLAFERAVQQARAGAGDSRAWRTALALWTGEPFADLPYAPFITPHGARLRELHAIASEERRDAELAEGRQRELIPELEAAVAEEPYRERTWRQLMLALYRDGRQADALATYQRARTVLADDLGLDPGPALAMLERAILGQDPALDPAARPAGPGSRLPPPTSDLVGRVEELARLRDAVVGERLTTLLGPGGVGKTRLALEVGRAAADVFADGVVFVDLASTTDRGELASEVARACGVMADNPLDALAAAIGNRRVLLILDNVEQIPEAGLEIHRLLDALTGVHLLATSRVVLRVRGEHVVPLGPLDPSDGAELFVRRAQATGLVGPDPALARQVVTRLDGLPLAIELAAASARILPGPVLLARLEAGVPLPGGPGDLPARQQTIEATIRWTSQLLGASARRTWCEVAAFASAFTLDAASRLAGREVTGDVVELVDASVLTLAESRYQMLQSLRAAVAVLLPDPRDRDVIADRHADWALETALDLQAVLYSPRELEARAELRRLLPELRVACDRLVATARDDDAARLLVATSSMWYHDGLTQELRRRLDLVVESRHLSPRGGGEARVLRAVLVKLAGDTGAIDVLRETTGQLRTTAGDSVILANGLCHLADLEADTGHAEEAFRLADEALEVARRSGDAASVVMTLDLSSYVAQVLGDHGRAVEASRAALREADAASPQRINALAGLALALHRAGETTEAVDAGWQAVAEAEILGSAVRTAEVALAVAPVLIEADRARFTPRLAQAIVTFLAFGGMRAATRGGALLLEVSAPVAPEQTARMLGALEARTAPEDAQPFEPLIAGLRERLGPELFARERAAGRSLGDDDLARLTTAVAAGAGLELPPA